MVEQQTKIETLDSRKQDIWKILQKLSRVEISTIQPHAALKDLGLDSLDRLQLLFELERFFDVEISDDQAVAMKTIGDVLAYVEARCPMERT